MIVARGRYTDGSRARVHVVVARRAHGKYAAAAALAAQDLVQRAQPGRDPTLNCTSAKAHALECPAGELLIALVKFLM